MLSTVILGEGEWSHEDVDILEEYLWDDDGNELMFAEPVNGSSEGSAASAVAPATAALESLKEESARTDIEEKQQQDPSLFFKERWNKMMASSKSVVSKRLALDVPIMTSDTGSAAPVFAHYSASMPAFYAPRNSGVVSPASSGHLSMEDGSVRSSSTMQSEPSMVASLQQFPSFPMPSFWTSNSGANSLAPMLMNNGRAGSFFTTHPGGFPSQVQQQPFPMMATMMANKEQDNNSTLMATLMANKEQANSMFALLNGPNGPDALVQSIEDNKTKPCSPQVDHKVYAAPDSFQMPFHPMIRDEQQKETFYSSQNLAKAAAPPTMKPSVSCPATLSKYVPIVPSTQGTLEMGGMHECFSTPLLASYQSSTNKATKRRSATAPPEDQEEEHQRKRACFFAKKSREKKRLEMEALKDEFLLLKQENTELQDLIQHHFTLKDRRAILNECNATSQIPQEVWEACRPEADDDDEDEISSRVSFVSELLIHRRD